MQNLLSAILIALFSLSACAYAGGACKRECYEDRKVYSNLCTDDCYSPYPEEPFQVDNACVDFCVDHKHSLSECQHSCWN